MKKLEMESPEQIFARRKTERAAAMGAECQPQAQDDLDDDAALYAARRAAARRAARGTA
jgi:hypothetical protein